MKSQRVCELTQSIYFRTTDFALFNTHFLNGHSRSPDLGPASNFVPRSIHSYTKHALIVRCHRLDNGPVYARHHAQDLRDLKVFGSNTTRAPMGDGRSPKVMTLSSHVIASRTELQDPYGGTTVGLVADGSMQRMLLLS